jgi:hypothetical protein
MPCPGCFGWHWPLGLTAPIIQTSPLAADRIPKGALGASLQSGTFDLFASNLAETGVNRFAKTSNNTMGSKPIQYLWAIGAAGIGLFAASRIFHPSEGASPSAQSSPLLDKVQALGELHSVKYTYRDVHEFQTSEKPNDLLAVIPGATDVVRAATQNTALLSYTGTVEAGVDLSKAKIGSSPQGIQITLPEPKIYPANVVAKVEDMHRGWVWRDISIATDAIADAKVRFTDTSIRQGILSEAKRNARTRVLELSRSLVQVPVTVEFAS